MRSAVQILIGLALLGLGDAQSGPETRNWFNDPFFQATDAIPQCPAPAGPFMTEAEKLEQSHHRAEKGTTCWLAGKCRRPNFYAYDQDIAEALKSALTTRNPAPDSTLWVTVQGRVVYFEGCVRRQAVEAELEALARSIPDVQQAIALVYAAPRAAPPHKLRFAPPDSESTSTK
jgi:hypothetical protein